MFGFGILAWVLGRYFVYGSSVPGFAFLASIIAIFSGAQMFTLGIFGEYLSRMYGRTMERPAYVVLETCEPAALRRSGRRPHRPSPFRERFQLNFDYRMESIRTPALSLDYYLVPWDTEILGRPVAQIADVVVTSPIQAARDYRLFLDWCTGQAIALCACRLPADRLSDSMFLEEQGFRFIELNYLPRLSRLQELSFSDEGVHISQAEPGDREVLEGMAGQVFRDQRFHQDPLIDPSLGHHRYQVWMANAFTHPKQRVL